MGQSQSHDLLDNARVVRRSGRHRRDRVAGARLLGVIARDRHVPGCAEFDQEEKPFHCAAEEICGTGGDKRTVLERAHADARLAGPSRDVAPYHLDWSKYRTPPLNETFEGMSYILSFTGK